jgi:hypothetical protein
MKKIAVLTLNRVQNHGALLQAYALQKTLTKLGAHCEILDLLLPRYEQTNIDLRFNQLSGLKQNIGSSKEQSKSLKVAIKGWAGETLENFLVAKARLRFCEFSQNCLKFSPITYSSMEDLYTAELDYDAYVTGSDQVWNPTSHWNPEPFFLTFVPPGIARIAYAPSFGVSSIDTVLQPQYSEWLKNLSHLSVREIEGAEIIKQLTGRNPEVVLDPTLLLTADDWKALAIKPDIKKPYIFCYSVGDVPGLMPLCYHVQKLTGYPIYKINKPRHAVKDLCNRRIKAIRDAGPKEFLGYLMNAEIVVTNSFHGTVLSINFQKPFFTVFSSSQNTYSRDSRMLSILKILSASYRLYSPGQELPSTKDFEMTYHTINEKLNMERKKSLSYLNKVIGESKINGLKRKDTFT